MGFIKNMRSKLSAKMAQKGMEPDMADRAGRALFRRDADRGGMRMQPPTPVNRPVPDELVYKKGGSVKESKAMMKKEVAFMKKKGAPKSMIRHEEKEAGMKKGVKKMAFGGMSGGFGSSPREAVGTPMRARRVVSDRPMQNRTTTMAKGGMAKSGGSFRKAADGVASKGKTKGKMVKMNKGGYC